MGRLLTLRAPAKINWFLKVLGLRKDGFHEIESLIQKVTLYDHLTFTPSPSLEIVTDLSLPGEQNIVYRAAEKLRDRYRIKQGASITLKKHIPVGAGLGGGSSDAAAALVGLSKLWAIDVSTEKLAGIASELGSDVPFFLYGSMCLVSGRGERIEARNAMKPVDLLLVKPDFGISTEWSYRTLSERRSAEQKGAGLFPAPESGPELTKKAAKVNNIEHFIRCIERVDSGGTTGIVSNDLESVATERYPVIAEIKERLMSQGAVLALMSGSGSTVFGLFDSRDKTEEASKSFDGFWTAAVRTITGKSREWE